MTDDEPIWIALVGMLSFYGCLGSGLGLLIAVIWESDYWQRVSATCGASCLFAFIAMLITAGAYARGAQRRR